MEWADARVWSEVLRTADARDDPWLCDKVIQRGYVLHTTDADFLRLLGLRWANPCR